MPPARVLLQLSKDSLLDVNTIYHTSNVTDGGQRGEFSPWQAKHKYRSPTKLIFRF